MAADELWEGRSELQEVVSNVFISNVFGARSKAKLQDKGISRIVVAAAELDMFHESQPDLEYLRLPLADNPGQKLMPSLAEGCDFIQKARSEGRACLVHCAGGGSRSASVVIGFLLRHESSDFPSVEAALQHLKAVRPIVEPNWGFLEQLREFEGTAPTAAAATNGAASSSAPSGVTMEEAKAHLMAKAKPPGSLGTLEDWAASLCVLQGTKTPAIDHGRLMVFAGDHGVTEEKVSPFPSAVTRSVFAALASGGAAAAVLSRSVGVGMELVDVGMTAPVAAAENAPDHLTVVQDRVQAGTANFCKGPAMSPEVCEAALDVGRRATDRAVASASSGSSGAAEGGSGPRLALCIGELGIGNTTPSSALIAALSATDPQVVVGPGTGLDDEGVRHKVEVVRSALALHAEVVASGDGRAILAALGGLEIAAMAGAMLRAAELRLPVIVDGFISTAAALVATRIDGGVAQCLFLATKSAEKGQSPAISALQDAGVCAAPALDMQLRLGEGTGAVLCFPILRAAAQVATSMISLESALALPL